MNGESIQLWNQTKPGNNGRPRLFNDLAITTALMVRRVFSILLRDLQVFISSASNLFTCRCHVFTIHASVSKSK
ncbi:transposase [Candidatus Enterovibrio altilux]|uniref:transposase n=1 Tax=Candidatus Enterovibrio altilux TaxID=1927128 RepID=UPI0021E06BE3